MIKPYLIFCSVIYHFYVQKKDNTPGIYVFWATSLLLSLNILGVYDTVRYFIYPNLPFTNIILYGSLAMIGITNYLFIIHSGQYKEIKPTKKQGYFSVIYIVISIVFVAWIATLHHDRNFQQ
jgi:hypothetical protein